MSSRALAWILGALAGAALLSAPAAAQDFGRDQRANETHISLNWIMGRWRMPVTCEREDGSTVAIEESIVFRPAPEDAMGRTVRATFFGIDVADAKRCYNLIETRLRDRRGVLYLTFVSQQDRTDVGLSRLRRTLEDGEISYTIVRGKLRVREIGNPDAEPLTLDYAGLEGKLTARVIKRLSDGDKLLGPYAREKGVQPDMRRLSFLLHADTLPQQRGWYLEDPSRKPGQSRQRAR